MKGWRLEKTARRATGAGALGGRAPHERTVAGAPPRLQGARTTPPPACASTRSAGTPCGSGCYGLRFASVLRTSAGLRPASPCASLTREARQRKSSLEKCLTNAEEGLPKSPRTGALPSSNPRVKGVRLPGVYKTPYHLTES